MRSQKTEHHGAEHAVRVVPIRPELRAVLGAALPGATWIAPMAARKDVNLGTYLRRIVEKAGHKAWPRLFQNLRASCATDWVERYPAHVVAKWLGHSPKVAATHYLQAREHHFEDVVAGGGAGPGNSADCSAPTAQIAAQQLPAGSRRLRHKTTEPAATIQVAAGSSKLAPVTETGTRHEAAEKNSRQGPWTALPA